MWGRWIVEYVVRGVGRRALWEGVDWRVGNGW